MIALALLLAASPYQVRFPADLPIIGITGAMTLGTELSKKQLVTPGCTCLVSELNPLDRLAVGPYDRAYGLASDVTLIAAIAAPFVASMLEVLVGRETIVDWLKDATVLAEVLAVNLALTQLVKLAAQRARPFVYSTGEAAAGDAKLSFYSGHSSSAFAMGNALAMTFQLRYPKSPWRYVVWIASNLAAATIGLLRVGAHMHFFTDVIVGGAIGAAIGVMIPAAHVYSW